MRIHSFSYVIQYALFLSTSHLATVLTRYPLEMKSTSSPSSSSQSFPMVVVFGRPGAGKTTIADCALQKAIMQRHDIDKKSRPLNAAEAVHAVAACTTTGIDLDIYVPQFMKDNFGAGIYPDLQQRQDFAHAMCKSLQEDLLEKQQQQQQQQQQQLELQQKSSAYAIDPTAPTTTTESVPCSSPLIIVATIISFSFVNNDLRDIFRHKFPHASWVLVDTTEQETEKRIRERTGHFYKGSPDEMTTAITTTKEACEAGKSTSSNADNAKWKFDPVTFPHVVLNGNDPIDMNADIVVQTLFKAAEDRRSLGIATFT